jgi:hypothetical protein
MTGFDTGCWLEEGCSTPDSCKKRAKCATPNVIYNPSSHPDERMHLTLKDFQVLNEPRESCELVQEEHPTLADVRTGQKLVEPPPE